MSVTRTNKPRCTECSHPISFHGVDFERCQALGCSCEGYVGDTYLAVSTLSVDQVAERLGRPAAWVTRNASVLGGERRHWGDVEVARDAKGRRKEAKALVWRFDPEVIEKHLEETVAGSKHL